MEIFIIIAFFIVGWALTQLHKKSLAMSKRIDTLEQALEDMYAYRFEVSMSIDWVRLFSKINPQKSEDEIRKFISLFRNEETSLLSISTITWKYETESLFWISRLTEEVEHWWRDLGFSDIHDKTYQGLGYRGLLFGKGDLYEKHKKEIRDLFSQKSWFNPERHEDKFLPYPFILHPEKIGFRIDDEQHGRMTGYGIWSLSPLEEIGESFSEIPFATLIQTCVEERKKWTHPEEIIQIVRKKRSTYTYDLTFFEAVWNSRESFDFESGAVRLSVKVDTAKTDMSF